VRRRGLVRTRNADELADRLEGPLNRREVLRDQDVMVRGVDDRTDAERAA
jgi:hypothetical protein